MYGYNFEIFFFYTNRRRLNWEIVVSSGFWRFRSSSAPTEMSLYFIPSTFVNHVITCRATIYNTVFLYSQKTINTEKSLFPAVFAYFDSLSLQREWAYIFYLAL